MSAHEMRVMTNMRMFGDASFSLDQHEKFPLNPAAGQFALVEGILYIYARLGVVETWFPLTNKKSSHVHFQAIASSEWVISHNYNTDEYVFMVYSEEGNIIHAKPTPIDKNKFQLNFGTAIKGKVVVFIHSDLAIPRLATEDGIIETLTVNQVVDIAGGKVVADANGLTVNDMNVSEYLSLHSEHLQIQADMFSNAPDHIEVKKSLLPAHNMISIGSQQKPLEQIYSTAVSADTIDLDSNDQTLGIVTTNALTLQAKAINAELHSAQLKFIGLNHQAAILSYDESEHSIRLHDAQNNMPSFHAKDVVTSSISSDTALINSLNISENTNIGTSHSDTLTVNSTTTFHAPVSFGDNGIIGSGDDTIIINAGVEKLLTVVSKHFSLDELGKLAVKNLTVSENFSVAGTITTHNTHETSSQEQYFQLLSETDTQPTLDAGIKVNRGQQKPAHLLWDETLDTWTIGVDGDMAAITRKDDLSLLNINDKEALISGATTSLHFHMEDRDRANHTGTQLANSIRDLDSAIATNPAVINKVEKAHNKQLSTHDLTDQRLEKLNNALVSVTTSDITDLPDLSGLSPHPADDFSAVEVANLRSGKTATGETMLGIQVFGGDTPPPHEAAGINDIWFNTAGDATTVEVKSQEGFKQLVTIASEMNMQHSDVEYVQSPAIKEYTFTVDGDALVLKPKFLTVYLNRKLLRKSEYVVVDNTTISILINLSINDEIEAVTA
ncbi:hypothetical protein CWB96_00025 [Pseudoalteromonas citrea]|uniref:Uncharacterized protein n=1 Tax=Pseudoalteromonas citrea TaxID=43655 RepID=A0A5S3XXR7_9GAMM|nr:hypothetical protein [Pseudoalteromonas citrea]TMP46339.1 hypothetical protein CWB97_02455 [Pseudoalteromonas citrea]TMP63030.1 hypothetical protein CWB96_00025 [Pseudoalteromonas citrea]